MCVCALCISMDSVLVLSLLVCIYASTVQSLSCVPCGSYDCANVTCTGGVGKDECGCCDVCLKQAGEACGGTWGIMGKCADNLRCIKNTADYHSEGICKLYNGTCDWPRTLVRCGSACPPTCDNPEPQICIEICRVDDCVCSQGLLEHNGTCVMPSECPKPSTANCTANCSSLDLSMTTCERSKAWVCELRNWRCQTREWKLAADDWWNESGCSDPEYERQWADLYACNSAMPKVQCKNASSLQCTADGFGCQLCHCTDGKYIDDKQLMKIWKYHLDKYLKSKELYQQAREICLSFGPTC